MLNSKQAINSLTKPTSLDRAFYTFNGDISEINTKLCYGQKFIFSFHHVETHECTNPLLVPCLTSSGQAVPVLRERGHGGEPCDVDREQASTLLPWWSSQRVRGQLQKQGRWTTGTTVKELYNLVQLICIDRTWNDVRCPTKWRESLLCQTLQVHITSDTKKIPFSDWPKWRCTLLRKFPHLIYLYFAPLFLRLICGSLLTCQSDNPTLVYYPKVVTYAWMQGPDLTGICVAATVNKSIAVSKAFELDSELFTVHVCVV